MLGTTRVVVSRILKKLENKGLIHLNVRLIFYEKDSTINTDMIEVIFKHLKRRYIGLHLNLNKMEGKKKYWHRVFDNGHVYVVRIFTHLPTRLCSE